MSSVWISPSGYGSADLCLDGNETKGWCHSLKQTAPWLALDYGSEVKVSSVVLFNHGDQTRNVNIRVSSSLPVSDRHWQSGSEMFSGGQLLGTFEGPGTRGQRIEVTGGSQLTGRYVVVQMNHTSGASRLILREVTAWGQAQGRTTS